MERYQLSWKSHLEPDPEGTVVYYADAQATVEALQRERDQWKEAFERSCDDTAHLRTALDAEREKVKGLEAKVELQETAVRCAGHALDESRETHNRQAAKIREQQEQLSQLQGEVEADNVDEAYNTADYHAGAMTEHEVEIYPTPLTATSQEGQG